MARSKLTRQELSLQIQAKGLKQLLDSNKHFLRFVWTIFTEAHIFDQTYSRGSPHDTSYNEGRRALGLEVLHMLKHVRPDVLSLIEREGWSLFTEVEAAQTQDESEDEYANLPDPEPEPRDS